MKSKRASMCRECRIKTQPCKRPPKEELNKLLKTNSNIAISEKFNVSETAVRKWKQYYRL